MLGEHELRTLRVQNHSKRRGDNGMILPVYLCPFTSAAGLIENVTWSMVILI